MSSDGTNRLYCTHTPHTHIHIPACIVPKLASRRGRCWSECHGWVNPKKEGTAQQHWWAELLLSVASCLDRMGFTAAQGHVALSGVWEDRHGGSAVGTVHDLSPFTASFQSLQQPGLVTLPTRLWCVVSTSSLSPSETSSLSHADEPRDHPRSITVHLHRVKGPHMHTNSGLYAHPHTIAVMVC